MRIKRETLAIILVSVSVVAAVEVVLAWLFFNPPDGACVLVTPGCIPIAQLSLESDRITSPTNMTITIVNFGRGTTTLVSYLVRDQQGNVFENLHWSGPTIGKGGAKVTTSIFIDGKLFTFHDGTSYSLGIITTSGDNFGFTILTNVSLLSDQVNTPTNVTLTLLNSESSSVTFLAYSIRDPQGHWFNSTGWSGPTLGPGNTVSTNLLIDGAAFTFQHGNWYTIQLAASDNKQFTLSFMY